MAITDADLLNALRDCYDPQLRRNIVELHMVKVARLTLDQDAPGANILGVGEKYVAEVRLAANNADDDAGQQLVAQVRNRLAGLPFLSRAEVTLLPPTFPILNTKGK